MAETKRAAITGVGHYVPPRCLTNAELEEMVDTSDEWIRERTGISERHICGPEMATSDLACEASRRALENAGVEAAELDLIIVSTATPDMLFPATANLVQHRLGAMKAGACDMSCGCAGFLYAMSTGSQFIASGHYKKILVVGADTISRILDWTDRRTCVLFGDGAGAVVLEPSEDDMGILSFVLRSDGAGGDFLRLPAGGSRLPASHETVDQKLHYVHMVGSEVFKFAVKVISDITQQALDLAGLGVGDIDLFVPHQANLRIIDSACKRLQVPMERVYTNVQRYGNTSCGSVPVALSEAVQQGRLKKGDILASCGFGAGLSSAGTVVRWSYTPKLEGASHTNHAAAQSQPEVPHQLAAPTG